MLEAQSLDEAIVDPKTYQDTRRMDELFDYLRRESPVHWTAPADYRPFWAITKHADVKTVEREGAVFIAQPRSGLFTAAFEDKSKAMSGMSNPIRSLPRMDDPDHATHRALTEAWFSAKNLRTLDAQIRKLAVRSIDRMEELGGECDFVRDVSVWFPLRVIMLILGVPAEDEPVLLRLTQELFGPSDPEMQRTRDTTKTIFETLEEYKAYFGRLTAECRANPRDDLASVIANAIVDGTLIDDWMATSYYITLAAAGHDTTSSTIAGGLHALIENPDQMALLRANPRMMSTGVEEMLRWITPIRQFMRTATRDFELRGTTIRAGEAVMMCYPSANRDADVFVDPYAFRVDRTPNPQMSFGYGAHLCLGLILARMEIKALFEELLARVDHIELAGEPAWVQSNFIGGLKRLPIRYRMRARAERVETPLADIGGCPVAHG